MSIASRDVQGNSTHEAAPQNHPSHQKWHPGFVFSHVGCIVSLPFQICVSRNFVRRERRCILSTIDQVQYCPFSDLQ